jgi:hypothetical protein
LRKYQNIGYGVIPRQINPSKINTVVVIFFLFFLIKIPLKCVISLVFPKKIGQVMSKKTEKISEVTVFKNQYFLKKKYRPLAVLRKEASVSLLQAFVKFDKY